MTIEEIIERLLAIPSSEEAMDDRLRLAVAFLGMFSVLQKEDGLPLLSFLTPAGVRNVVGGTLPQEEAQALAKGLFVRGAVETLVDDEVRKLGALFKGIFASSGDTQTQALQKILAVDAGADWRRAAREKLLAILKRADDVLVPALYLGRGEGPKCPDCGSLTTPGANFCSSCGEELPPAPDTGVLTLDPDAVKGLSAYLAKH